VIKGHGGTATPTSYLFQKKGRIVLEKDDRSADDILDEVIEAGGEDIEMNSEGNVVVYTDPTTTSSTANSITKLTGLTPLSSDITYLPNKETTVEVDSEENVKGLGQFVSDLQEDTSVQGVYVNAVQGKVDDESWADLRDKISI
jgi:transcriptional/translational regulatory protein YebC/TACO1